MLGSRAGFMGRKVHGWTRKSGQQSIERHSNPARFVLWLYAKARPFAGPDPLKWLYHLYVWAMRVQASRRHSRWWDMSMLEASWEGCTHQSKTSRDAWRGVRMLFVCLKVKWLHAAEKRATRSLGPINGSVFALECHAMEIASFLTQSWICVSTNCIYRIIVGPIGVKHALGNYRKAWPKIVCP